MLLQTNSYVVPKDRRAEHQRLMRRFRQALVRLGCEAFEVYEQVGSNWSGGEATGRYVQMMKFRDRKHQQQVQHGERTDPQAQALIAEFCEMINFPYQQQQGLFAVGFYAGALPTVPPRTPLAAPVQPVEMEPSPDAEMAEMGAGSEPASELVQDEVPTSELAELEPLDLDATAASDDAPPSEEVPLDVDLTLDDIQVDGSPDETPPRRQ